MVPLSLILLLLFICLPVSNVFAFAPNQIRRHDVALLPLSSYRREGGEAGSEQQEKLIVESSSSYETSGATSKGIVSSLTGLVNFIMGGNKKELEVRNNEYENVNYNTTLCTSPKQLMDKIKDDYMVNNYLWTGDIYLPAFEPKCRFSDPTLSFEGRDKFVSNVQNLIPIVDFFTEEGDVCKSELLDIKINEKEGYIESRWNMVGSLSVLPWKPRIDVIGNTKFWYRESILQLFDEGSPKNNYYAEEVKALRVYYYDEKWEMPAGRALLQIVTPGGTIRSIR